MNNFLLAYIIVGLFLYLIICTVITYVGIDNIKNLTDDENIKNLDLNSPLTVIYMSIICIFLWPLLIIINYNNNR